MKNEDILNSAKTALIDKNFSSNLSFKPTLLVNNDKCLQAVIIEELENCESFKFSAAFITLGGVQAFKNILDFLKEKNVPGKILTTDYQYFTEPKAIKFLNSYDNIKIKIFKHIKKGFHTKGYLFKKNRGYTGIIGSSNLTANALNSNEEWNIGFTSAYDGELLNKLNKEFNKLWNEAASYDEYYLEYESIYKKSRTYNKIKKITQNAKDELNKQNSVFERFIPNEMQNEFLRKMDLLIERGENKAILVSATGTGKTYASAFEVKRRNPKKFLFLVHRFQILKQAKETYEKVINDSSLKFGCLGDGYDDTDADFLFSTFQSLNSNNRYKKFKKDYFDYIVVDEVHRSVADTYQNIISHFEPNFLLGMTATPWRSDDKDIFELFDNNIVHEVTLQDSLNNNLVCPFHYYGISDLDIIGENKNKNPEFTNLISEERARHIINKSNEYGYSGDSLKSLVFCSSIAEANELAKIFSRWGFNSESLSGKDSIDYRNETINRLVDDESKNRLEYIFTYDVFNEGVDIPQVNQVIFIRKTKSPIVFTQQLGRGLRLDDSKDFLVVLDFIGNYKNNYMIPIALSGLKKYTKDDLREFILPKTKIIQGSSSVSLDKISRVKILRSIDSCNFSQKLHLKEKYHILKRKINKIPMLCDIFDSEEFDASLIFNHNTFSNYYKFLEYCHQNDTVFNNVLEEKYHYSLDFISQELSCGIRPHELIILNLLKHNKYFTIELVENILKEEYGLLNQLENIKGAMNVLNFDFYLSNKNKINNNIKKYINGESNIRNTFFMMNDDIFMNLELNKNFKFEISNEFNNLLKNHVYLNFFEDVIDYSLKVYVSKYKDKSPLKLYEKYSMIDFCRLYNWNYNDSSTIFGYKEKNNICPIFVKYEKDEKIPENLNYEDKFESNEIFKWDSRDIAANKIKYKSEKELIEKFIYSDENEVEFHLFIKKSEDDDKYYYFGKVNPFIRVTPENKPLIYKFDLKLETHVKDSLYEYFITPLYHNLE